MYFAQVYNDILLRFIFIKFIFICGNLEFYEYISFIFLKTSFAVSKLFLMSNEKTRQSKNKKYINII